MMKDKIKIFKREMEKAKSIFDGEYNDITASMNPYDVSAFLSELNHEYGHYSEKYFNEETFAIIALQVFDVDLNNSEIKDSLFDSIKVYSQSLITLKTLKQYLEDNNIELDEDE